ncbi:MAG TPA: hypothetical protein VHS30_29175, partial [Streptosporangiaceae bacterium]|nr:hypothetical protein [Streptosporangiaceae bacterium]
MLATDGWERAKTALGSLWRRSHPDQPDAIDTDLADSRAAVLAARDSGNEQAERDLESEWRGRLRYLVAADPALIAGLSELVQDLRAALSAVEHAQGGHIEMHAHASGHAQVFLGRPRPEHKTVTSEPADREPAEGQLPGDDVAGIQLTGYASGNSTIIQSGHDTNYYLSDGVRQRRLTDGPAAGECPYPGLAPFTQGQARWYWGRQRQVAELLNRLDGRRRGGGPLVVLAPSGAGKSSLFQAGLIPALREGRLPGAGSREWPCLVFTPTAHPIAWAAEHIASVAGADPGDVAAELAADPSRGPAILREALGDLGPVGDDTALAVVVVDQLEELFTLCENEQERRDFIDLLTRLAAAPAGGVPVALVACGLRADFYAPCTRYPQLR